MNYIIGIFPELAKYLHNTFVLCGLALASLFVVFQLIITHSKLPALKRADGSEILKLMILRGTAVVMMVVFLAFTLELVKTLVGKTAQEDHIQQSLSSSKNPLTKDVVKQKVQRKLLTHPSQSNRIEKLSEEVMKANTADNQLKGNHISKLPLSDGDKILLKTNKDLYVSSYDSKGKVISIKKATLTIASDEIFFIKKIAEDNAPLKSGDKVYLTTRNDYYFNSNASKGEVTAINTHSSDPNVSDEIFTIRNLQGVTICSGDKITLETRTGYYLSAKGFLDQIRAVKLSTTPKLGDNAVFEITSPTPDS